MTVKPLVLTPKVQVSIMAPRSIILAVVTLPHLRPILSPITPAESIILSMIVIHVVHAIRGKVRLKTLHVEAPRILARHQVEQQMHSNSHRSKYRLEEAKL